MAEKKKKVNRLMYIASQRNAHYGIRRGLRSRNEHPSEVYVKERRGND